MSARRITALLGGVLVLGVSAAGAQQSARSQNPLRPDLRLDALGGAAPAVQLGGGILLPMGYYVRLDVDAAAGPAWRSATLVGSARGDVIARFLLDPFRQSRWGLSLGGGVSVRHDAATGTHPWLAVVVDLEGPPRGSITPAFQLGLGGGLRGGVILRRSAPPFRR